MTARIFIALFTLLALFACSEDKSVNPGPAPEVGAGKTLAEASFADQDLARVLRWALKKPRGATITTDELATLTRLRADEQGITNLAGIQHCINLDTLLLWGNDITDIQPLADLTKLERLDLGANEIADARPLEGLVNLTHLSLWGNQVTDIQPLTKLTQLEKLSLWGNGITDVRPLAKLTRLTQLQLGENEITDVSALDGLTRLNWLGLVGNPLSDSALRQQIPTLMKEGVLISVRYPGPSSPVTVEDEPEPKPEPMPEPEPEPEQPEPSDDRAVLLAFYEATGGGSDWTGDNWGSDEPISTWQGVSTDEEGRVIRLELQDNQLSGTIPPELAQLTNLQALNLGGNQLTGAIPPELAQLTNLFWLTLEYNQLTGAIPPELAQLNNLGGLYLAGNNLSGCIPTGLYTIERSDLNQLGLDPCEVLPEHPADRAVLLAFYEATSGGSAWTGDNWGSDEPIGTWQGVTTDDEGRVTKLTLEHNQLTGAIPPELAQLNNLTSLNLFGNQLTGAIPPELAQLTNLTSLILETNQLTGAIPPELAQLNNLTWLSLGQNQLSGAIPPELAQLNNLGLLALQNNQLSGAIPPELVQLNNLWWLGLAGNNLSGCIPASLQTIHTNDLDQLGLSFCQLPSDPADRAVLLVFYEATGGGSDWTGDNWGSDEPIGTWQGVTTDTEGRVTELRLHGLGLTGAIPLELSQLTNLQLLRLEENALSGCIPALLQEIQDNDLNLLRLSLCDESGQFPEHPADRAVLLAFYEATSGGSAWTGDNWGSDEPIGAWQGVITDEEGRVTELRLHGLGLTGAIPTELSQLNNLQSLNLGGNQLTGAIPTELNQLNNLQSLGLNGNQLTGAIPAELGQLTNLGLLILDDNQLTGSIPPELAQLNNLGVLALLDNQLTGSIPPELAQLNNLQWLVLGGNNFSGCIPASLQTIQNNDLDQLGLTFCDG